MYNANKQEKLADNVKDSLEMCDSNIVFECI